MGLADERKLRQMLECTYNNDPSQVIRTVQLNPRIVMKPKLLLRTGLLPRRARVASSLEYGSEIVDPKMPS